MASSFSVQDPTSDSEDRDFKFNFQEIARATASEFYKSLPTQVFAPW